MKKQKAVGEVLDALAQSLNATLKDTNDHITKALESHRQMLLDHAKATDVELTKIRARLDALEKLPGK